MGGRVEACDIPMPNHVGKYAEIDKIDNLIRLYTPEYIP